MGFRSTLTTEHYWWEIPEWFTEKHGDMFNFGALTSKDGKTVPSFPIGSRTEKKYYSLLNEEEIFVDIQKLVREYGLTEIVAVLLHECGGITRVAISQDKIRGSEPTGWKEVQAVEHDYCYKCSDLPEEAMNQPTKDV